MTLNDIARHAGVGVGTVYRRFPDKEVLIEALFEERVAELEAIAIAGLAMADPWEGIVRRSPACSSSRRPTAVSRS